MPSRGRSPAFTSDDLPQPDASTLSEEYRSLLGLALIVVQRFAQNGLFPFIERYLDRRPEAPPAGKPEAKQEGGYANPP